MLELVNALHFFPKSSELNEIRYNCKLQCSNTYCEIHVGNPCNSVIFRVLQDLKRLML